MNITVSLNQVQRIFRGVYYIYMTNPLSGTQFLLAQKAKQRLCSPKHQIQCHAICDPNSKCGIWQCESYAVKKWQKNSIDFKAKMIGMGDVLMYRVILCFVYLRICIRIFCFSRSFFLKDCKKELLFSSLFER